jgi:hypothetical protein
MQTYPHHHGQFDAEPLRGAERLNERDEAAAEEIGRDEHGHLFGAKLECAAHDERHRNRASVHDQHMLQAEGGEFAGGEDFVDRVDCAGHGLLLWCVQKVYTVYVCDLMLVC